MSSKCTNYTVIQSECYDPGTLNSTGLTGCSSCPEPYELVGPMWAVIMALAQLAVITRHWEIYCWGFYCC